MRDNVEQPNEPRELDETSLRVQDAMAGDRSSIAWLVERFSPLLLAQARYRMGKHLLRVCDAEDVVDDVWAVALPRLSGEPTPEGRFTPVLVRFLSSILLHRVNEIARQVLREKRVDLVPDEASAVRLEQLAGGTQDVVTSIVRRETEGIVLGALERLDAADREVLVRRSIEQRSGEEAARLLGVERSTVYVRFHRAVRKLREHLPSSVFDDLEPPDQPPAPAES